MLVARLTMRRCLSLTKMPFALRQSQQADRGQKLRCHSNLPSGARVGIPAPSPTLDSPSGLTNYVPATCLASATSAEAPRTLYGTVASQEKILIDNKGRQK